MFLALTLLSLNICDAANAQMTNSPKVVTISSKMTQNKGMPFFERSGALALNVEYQDVKNLRADISKTLNFSLKFFDKWDPQGEGHVTVITPPEFTKQLAPYLVSEEDINRIADDFDIQSSTLKLLGIGSGKKNFNGVQGETFFVIVESARLLKIREAIYQVYLRNGGPVTGANAFNPQRFYPHITIGYTNEDIHENDGLLKDVKHSLDKRFKLTIQR
jgi:2'-5' RNA ligase